MSNKRGNVIVIVMLILGVITLVAVGALVMARYDLKFTSSLKSYDKGFNLADGAATLAFGAIDQKGEAYEAALNFTDQSNPPPPMTLFCECQNAALCANPVARADSSQCTRCVDRSVGNFNAQVRVVGYTTQPPPGWEAGTYYGVYWTGIGQAMPYSTITSPGTTKQVNTAYNATVEMAIQRTQRK